MNNLRNSALAGREPADELDAMRDGVVKAMIGFSDTANEALTPTSDSNDAPNESSFPKVTARTAPQRFVALPPHRGARFVKRFELPLLWIGGLAPAIALSRLAGLTTFTGTFVETIVALAASITAGWYILSRLLDHANARHLSYVLPVNAMALLSALAVLALLRIPYSALLFATGAMAAISTSFLLAVYSRRLVKPHLVVRGGGSNEVLLGGQFLPAPSLTELERLIDSGRGDWALVADLHYPHSETGERIFAKAALAGVPVYHFRQVAEMQSGQVKISHLSENDLGSLTPDASYTALKRFLDVLGALVLIPLCLPLFVILAIIIRLESPGNPIFIQERMGFRGQTFRMVKFRTMHQREVLADELSCRHHAMTKFDDKRITGIGHFLRKTRMDELPQIFNVLWGEMSFIGPRPEVYSLSQWYEAELPFYSYRHIVRPGITGWAQVNQGHVTNVNDVLGKLRYDFYYIKNISLWLDLLVTLKTLRVIVGGIGAK